MKKDWKEAVAGQRVVTIKPHESKGWLKHEQGELEFGTELVVAQDRSIVALLGASTAAAIAIGVLETPLISIAGEKQTRSRAASQARSSGCLPMCLPIAAWFT